MSKDRQGNFFEDFQVGQHLRHPTPRTLTEGDRSLYIALTGSRDPLSSAEAAATLAGLDARPLESLLVFNTAFGKTVPDLSLNAIANLGYADIRFLAPVYSGDTLSVTSDVIGLRENRSGQSGVVYVRSSASRQTGEEVLTWIRWVMVAKRDSLRRTGIDQVPALPASVAPQALRPAPYGKGITSLGRLTGSPDHWQHYAVGERINHLSAMTINDSDHSLATRLYQNTAKAHFDGHRMASSAQGRRLVYGGHVLSVCKALSYDGLENGLEILAIHGGTHVAPTFAGDTLSCATVVTDKFDLGDSGLGALRLRLIGAKNLDHPSQITFPPAGSGSVDYAAGIVLDLDYTIAMPKSPTEEQR